MKFKYVGPFAEVELPDIGAVVQRGGTVEVYDQDFAEGLAGQECWEPVDAKAKKTAATADDSQEG